jgi:hypothetical protein
MNLNKLTERAPLAMRFLRANSFPGDTIVVDVGADGELVFQRAGSASTAQAA